MAGTTDGFLMIHGLTQISTDYDQEEARLFGDSKTIWFYFSSSAPGISQSRETSVRR